VKGLLKFLVGGILGGVLGWGLGYLRIPMVEKDGAFWVGVGVCMAFVLFVVVAMIAWNKNAKLLKLLGRNSAAGDSNSAQNPSRTYVWLWAIMAGFVVLGGSVSSWMLYRQNLVLGEEMRALHRRILNQTELVESVRKSNQGFLMANVLDMADSELGKNPTKSLSEAAISRIVALSYALKPYRILEGDTLATNLLSPERGQLLLSLVNMEMDSSSFSKIKHKANFENADLQGANLSGKNLSGMNLRRSTLKDAVLDSANLNNVDLTYANIWGASFKGTSLIGADLVRADLRWAVFTETNLKDANLNGADLGNARLTDVDMTGATFRYGISVAAIIDHSNLRGVDLLVTNLARSRITNTNLSESNLRLVNFADAHLESIDLNETRVGQSNWSKVIQEWQYNGDLDAPLTYKVVEDSSKRFESAFLLKREVP
jgi:uncharacterized protein YjbI with pentapeptide repeats